MIAICLEIKTQCRSCGQPAPFNALVTRALCGHCSQPVDLAVDLWKSLLGSAIVEGPKLDLKEGRTQTIMGGGGTTNSMYGRMDARCEVCKTELQMDQAMAQAQQTNGWVSCRGCNRWITVRPTPAEAAQLLPGVTHLIGEDADQLAGGAGTVQTPAGKQPVNFNCPQCGAALGVDGSSRSVTCNYCHKPAYLPDELWQRLHPVKQVVRWYLWYDERAAAVAKQNRPIEWGSFHDAIIDADGTIYCIGDYDTTGDHDHEFAIWAMGQDFKPRWIRQDLKYSDDAKLALHPDGSLIVWEDRKHSILRLNKADGTTIGKLGGTEPPGAQVHHLDLKGAEDLACDIDGTYLMIIHHRILRLTAEGQGITTWPPPTGMFSRKEKLQPLYQGGTGQDDDSSRSSIRGDYDSDNVLKERVLTCTDSTRVAAAADGSLTFLDASYNWIARYDRQGKLIYRVKLEFSPRKGRPTSDQAGNTYILGQMQNWYVLVRVGPDGSLTQIAGDRRQGGMLSDDTDMAIAPNGAVWIFGYGTQVRVFGPDGALLYISEKARKDDEEELQKRKERIENDEDPD